MLPSLLPEVREKGRVVDVVAKGWGGVWLELIKNFFNRFLECPIVIVMASEIVHG